MQSNNPVFRRSEEFNRAGGSASYGPSAGAPTQYEPYGAGGGAPVQTTTSGPMTIDSVVQKTGITVGTVIVAAMVTWFVTPSITGLEPNVGPLIAAMTIGSLGAFALSMVNSFKRVVSPGLVIAFAVAEGIALGALSKFFDAMFSTPGSGNIVLQAVIGTFAAFGGTLAAYKYFNIQVGTKFRTFVMAAVFGMVGLSVLELVLGLFHAQMGLYGFGALGMLTAVFGLLLGVFMLILDFDFVEQGIRNQIPERESWRAAFAMTVSLVWIYTNLLRLLAILQQD